MPPRTRLLPAKVLAGIALTSACFALPASCGAPRAVPPSELVTAMAESASELRKAFEEHRDWYSTAELDPTLVQQERDEARRLRAEVSELLESLYALHTCEKEGWSRETVFISELVGQLEQAISTHVSHVAESRTELELRVEEGVYAIKVEDLLDELDSHIEAARAEVEQRPALRCRQAPPPSTRRNNVPLI